MIDRRIIAVALALGCLLMCGEERDNTSHIVVSEVTSELVIASPIPFLGYASPDTPPVLMVSADTGTNINPDLQPLLWQNPQETEDGIDNDGNGCVDDLHGCYGLFGQGIVVDNAGHGTYVSG